jgi:hypothetical protein
MGPNRSPEYEGHLSSLAARRGGGSKSLWAWEVDCRGDLTFTTNKTPQGRSSCPAFKLSSGFTSYMR